MKDTKEMQEWAEGLITSDKWYGGYSYKDYWDGYYELVRKARTFSDKEKEVLDLAISNILRDLRKERLEWNEETVDDLLLVLHDDIVGEETKREVRKLVEEGRFENNEDLLSRLFQTVFSMRMSLPEEIWYDLLERDPGRFGNKVFAGLVEYSLEKSFRVLNEVPCEELTRIGPEIRGLMARDDYTKDEVLKEAWRSKNYLSEDKFDYLKKALPEMEGEK